MTPAAFLQAALQSGQIDNPWSWVIAGYVIVYGAMLGLTAWLWIRLNRVQDELDRLDPEAKS